MSNAIRDRISELVNYDPESGILTWKVSRGGHVKAGNECGTKSFFHGKWYRKLMIDRKTYYAHRIAWIITYGSFNEKIIDHIDGNGLNNKISNLRCVSQKDNARNMRISKRNTSNHTGVYMHKPTGKWQARIYLNGKAKSLGLYFNKEDAAYARALANDTYGFNKLHGSSKQPNE